MKLRITAILSVIAVVLMAFSGPVAAVIPAAAAPAAGYTTYIGLVIDSTSASSASASTTLSSPSASSINPVSLSASTGTSSSSYAPQPGDSLLTRDKAFVDLTKSKLIVYSGSPVRVAAYLTGYLPDPCHVLRIVVGSATASGSINIQVYSLFKAGTACVTVIQPFSATVSLGSFTTGQYSVTVNGAFLGRFSAGAATTSGGTN